MCLWVYSVVAKTFQGNVTIANLSGKATFVVGRGDSEFLPKS